MANTATHASATHRHEPSWWNDQHSRAWDRVKDTFARDWEQMHADATAPHAVTDDHGAYDEAEPALRYGYGASAYYFDHDVWDASLEAKLRDDWSEIDAAQEWKNVRDRVRAGWERARGTRH